MKRVFKVLNKDRWKCRILHTYKKGEIIELLEDSGMNTGYFTNKEGRNQFLSYDDVKEITSNSIRKEK